MIKVTIDTSKATAKELQELKEKFGKMEGFEVRETPQFPLCKGKDFI